MVSRDEERGKEDDGRREVQKAKKEGIKEDEGKKKAKNTRKDGIEENESRKETGREEEKEVDIAN